MSKTNNNDQNAQQKPLSGVEVPYLHDLNETVYHSKKPAYVLKPVTYIIHDPLNPAKPKAGIGSNIEHGEAIAVVRSIHFGKNYQKSLDEKYKTVPALILHGLPKPLPQQPIVVTKARHVSLQDILLWNLGHEAHEQNPVVAKKFVLNSTPVHLDDVAEIYVLNAKDNSAVFRHQDVQTAHQKNYVNVYKGDELSKATLASVLNHSKSGQLIEASFKIQLVLKDGSSSILSAPIHLQIKH